MKPTDFGQLINIDKPARYLNNEIGAAHKSFEKQSARIALCFPDIYEIGMSNTGIILLYNILNAMADVVCERVFAPFPDYAELLIKNNYPLTSLESKTQLSKFDIVGFSFQYEIAVSNILYILKLGRIPLKNSGRGVDDPLVICGGPCAVNPEPLKDFVDVFVIGDGEEVIRKIALIIQSEKKRDRRLAEIAKLTGVFCPDLHKQKDFTVHRAIVYDYEKYLKFYKPFIPNIETIHNRINIEIMRGCTRGCRFCLAGYINRPVRPASPRAIKNTLNEFCAQTGIKSVTLSSLSSSDYIFIEQLLANIIPECDKKRIILSIPSLRIDTLDKLISFNLNETKKNSITIAPEAGSYRLRKKINKNLTDTDIENALRFAVDRGYQSIKLYFMIGLPDETEEDIRGIAEITKNLLYYGGKKIKRIRLGLSVFVPKPHTPLQWSALASEEQITEKIKMLCGMLRYKKIEINWHSYKSSIVEAIISRGDEKINNVILNAFNNGARFDDWKEYFNFEYWKNAAATEQLDIFKLAGEKNAGERLPWDYVNIGVKKEFLIDEYKNFIDGITVDDCRNGCHNCSDTINCGSQLIKNEDVEFENTGVETENMSETEPPPIEKFNYRIRYIKTNKIKFISHLDLQKLLLAGFANVKIPFDYTNGFNKKPKIEFTDALALGVIGADEITDIVTVKKLDDREIINKLNNFFNKNIIIKSIELLQPRKQSIIQSIKSFEYNIILHKNSGLNENLISEIFSGVKEITRKEKTKILNLDELILAKKFSLRRDLDIVNLKIKNLNGAAVNPYHILKNHIAVEFIVDIIRKKIVV